MSLHRLSSNERHLIDLAVLQVSWASAVVATLLACFVVAKVADFLRTTEKHNERKCGVYVLDIVIKRSSYRFAVDQTSKSARTHELHRSPS